VFSEFKARVKLETRKIVKCSRIDNGDYVDGDILAFYKQKGITRQFFVPHTPQQNSIIERMNKTLLDRTRVILTTLGVTKSFWVEKQFKLSIT